MQRAPGDSVLLLGLDIGSTTSAVLIAKARLERGSQGTVLRCRADDVVYRPAPDFTPMTHDGLDEQALGVLLDRWLSESGIVVDEVFAGGALVTGLAAQAGNIDRVERLVTERLGEQLVANASDPTLESWLAFMGSCALLSRATPEAAVINLDIGGGTTNPAWGRNGAVQATGCCAIGARHLQFEPGTYHLRAVSPVGLRLLDSLGLTKRPGETLTHAEVAQVVNFQVAALESLVTVGQIQAELRWLEDIPFEPQPAGPRIVTFSGGIGELIYAHAKGEPWPGTTCFGDLGVDLARAIVDSPVLSVDIYTHIPEQQGRATVTGLALNSSEISGASLYLPDASRLPLRNLPVIGQLHAAMPDAALAALLTLARGCQSGVCYQLAFADNDNPGAEAIRAFGLRLAAAIQGAGLDPALPLVFLLQVNAGKALGNYISDWGQTAQRLLVIDEVPVRDARFVNIGRSRSGVVPVTFYGLNNESENHEVRYG